MSCVYVSLFWGENKQDRDFGKNGSLSLTSFSVAQMPQIGADTIKLPIPKFYIRPWLIPGGKGADMGLLV